MPAAAAIAVNAKPLDASACVAAAWLGCSRWCAHGFRYGATGREATASRLACGRRASGAFVF